MIPSLIRSINRKYGNASNDDSRDEYAYKISTNFLFKVGWWNDAIFKMRPFNCFIFPLIPIVRGNGDRAIVSAKLISVFPYDLYSVSFNNCNTALSQASSRSCRILFRKYQIRGLNQ